MPITLENPGGNTPQGVTDGLSNTILVAERYQISTSGIREFLLGHVVGDSNDRRRMADTMLKGLGFSAVTPDAAIGLLLPAVQAAREAARRSKQKLSSVGALQFFSAGPVADPADRIALAAVFVKTEQTRQITFIQDL
jgi:hypothetical protein